MTFPMLRLKAVTSITPSNLDKVVEPDEIPVRLCNYVDVYRNDRITGDMDFMPGSAKPDEIRRFALRGGEVLITKDSETPDDIAVPAYVETSAAGVLCGYHLAILRSRPEMMQGRFLFWALKSAPVSAGFAVRAQGITRYGLTVGGIGAVCLPVPPLPVQREVADFLDRETARIDALVGKQEAFVHLLDERRVASAAEAILGRAATSSSASDADRAMLPSAWPQVPLRFLMTFVAGAGFPEEEQGRTDEELPFFKVRDLGLGDQDALLVETTNTVSRATARRLRARIVPPGSIAFAKIGAALLLNRFRMIGVPCCIDNNMMVGIARARVLAPTFALHLLRLLDMRLIVNPGAVPSLSEGRLASLKLPLPPLDQQQAIIDQISKANSTDGNLRARAIEMIERLREHRAALITAAVTAGVAAARPLADRGPAPARAA